MTLMDAVKLLGGLGMFLYGMHLMGEGLQSAAGNRLKNILERLTSNRLMGVLVGTFVTFIIQSSSATTVMVVGFVNAGLMTLSQAFGVILGANIGTTITAQIIAFNLTDLAPIFIFVGVIPVMMGTKNFTKSIGTLIAGFGILFSGMGTMSVAMEPLRDSAWFINFMTSLDQPLLGVLAGLVFTAVIQSSSASVGIVQTLALQGLVSIDAGLFLVLGCNIGTCATALIASIGSSTNAKRTAVMHLINKTIGSIVFTVLLLIFPISGWVQGLTPDRPMQIIANFYTLMNIINTVILFPLGKPIIKFVTKVIKSADAEEDEPLLLYLNPALMELPSAAITPLHKELIRMAEFAEFNLEKSLESFFSGDEVEIRKVFEREKRINTMRGEITHYIVDMQDAQGVSDADRQELLKYHRIITDIERVGDHADNVAEYALERWENKAEFSKDALDELKMMSDVVKECLHASIAVFADRGDVEMEANKARELEKEINHLHTTLRENHITRLSTTNCNPRAGMIFTDMAMDLERVGDHALNIINVYITPFH